MSQTIEAESYQIGCGGHTGEEKDEMMMSTVEGGVEGTGLLDKDSLVGDDDLRAREDPEQHRDEPMMRRSE